MERAKIVSGSKKKPKTMADIAKLAGVSTSTASRALQDSALISPRTKARVQATAQKYRYQPNLVARHLRLGKSNTLALVLPMNAPGNEIWSDPFVLKFLGAVGFGLQTRGYNLIVSQTSRVDARFQEQYLGANRVEGLILLGRGQDYACLNQLASGKVPFVVWGPIFPDQRYCSVGIDNIASAEQVVRHLLRLGRRRIAIIADRAETQASESRLRWQGYKNALADAGIQIDPKLETSATYSGASGYEAMRSLLQSAPDLDAVFVAYSDAVAIAAMQALQDAGRRIPDDVSLIGFDDIDLAAFTTPPLTTVSQRLSEGGVDLLIQKLVAQMDGKKTSSVMLDGQLVVRQSCGTRLFSH